MSSDATIATRTKISARFSDLGIAASAAELQKLADYFCLLAKWNDRINLTALPVSRAGSAAIDRLLVEPIAASRLVLPTDALIVDLGSGGGSPGFPLKIGAQQLRMVLVESRERKCAFLREVVRTLALTDVEVANTRFESLISRTDLAGRTDLVSFRAVRADDSLWSTVGGLLRIGGRAFWFGAPDSTIDGTVTWPGLALTESHILIPAIGELMPARLSVIQRTG